MFKLLLVFIILLGIVGAICCIDREVKKEVDKKDEYNAEEFEIVESKS